MAANPKDGRRRPKVRRRPLRRVEQFGLAQEALGMVTWAWDIARDHVEWYGDPAPLLGFAPGAFPGRYADYLACVHPDDVARAKATFVACLQGRYPRYRALDRVIWPDGSVHWLEAYGRAEYGEDGRAVRMSGVVRDVSEEKRQESARVKAEELLTRVFDASPDSIAISRASTGELVAVNAEFERVTGLRGAEIVGRKVPELGLWAVPEERARVLADLRAGGAVRDRPVQMRVRDGRTVSGTISAFLLEHDGEELFIGLLRDVTEAERLQRLARQSERKFASVFETSPDPIVISRRRDGVHVDVNSAWLRATGYTREQVLGHSVLEIGLWTDLEARRALLAEVDARGAVEGRPARLARANGDVFPALVSAARLVLEDEVCVIWTWRDISELSTALQHAQQAERKFASIFETSPDPVAISRGRDGVHLDVNVAWLRATGHSRERVIGRSGLEFGLWVDPAARSAILDELEAKGAVEDRSARFARANGETFPALISAAKLVLDDEPCVVWTWRDISMLSTALQHARQAERMFGALFERSPEPITLYRVSDGIRLAANVAWERESGYRRAAVVGRPITETMLWHDEALGARVVERVLAEGGVSNVEGRLVRADGTAFDALISAARIELDGEPCVLWSWRDMTERNRLAELVRQSERKFATLFESSPEPITLYRVSDRMRLAANSAWERVTGYPRQAVAGRSADAVSLFRDPGERDALVARVLAEGGISNAEVRLVRADGTELEALLSGASVEVDGERCILWNWRDLSQIKGLERQAHQSETKFASMFETTPVALVVSRALAGRGAEDRVVEINDAALSLLGVSRDEAIGAAASGLFTWIEPSAIEALRGRALAGERIFGAPALFDRRDGRRVEVLLSGATLEIGGEPHFVISLYDVTERNRIQREREDADARYRTLFASAMEGIVILSPQWTFVDLNPAACAFMGYRREELLGRPVTTVFSMAELEPDSPRHDGRWAEVERTLTRKDGTRRAIELQAVAMPDGNILVIARDVSERKRHEAMLMNIARGVSAELGVAFFQSLVGHLARELEADFAFIAELGRPDGDHFRSLAFVADGMAAPNFEYPVEGSPCATALDRRGTAVYASGVAELFPLDAGLRKHGVQGYVGTSLFGADGYPLGILVVMHRRPIERGQFWASIIEIFGARAAAEIERARAEALVRRTNESLEQLVRQRTSELEDANRALESYGFSVSHDLRQPLNAIAGFAELLRDAGPEAPPAQRREFLREIESNAERMDRMINALLELSHAGRGPLVKTEVDMRALVHSVLRDLSSGAPVRADIEIGELPAAHGDPDLLRQVWANLIGNALKYSRDRRVPRVRIWGEARNGVMEYAVSDNGVGFDMRHVERLFEAFHRLPSATSFEGSGVGLAIVQRIVRRHGGHMTPESAPGKGATFRFALPA